MKRNPVMLMWGLSHPQTKEDRWHAEERRFFKAPSMQPASHAQAWAPINGWAAAERILEEDEVRAKYGPNARITYHPSLQHKLKTLDTGSKHERLMAIAQEVRRCLESPAPVRATPHPLEGSK